MREYSPEVAELLDRGAEVTWYPVVAQGGELAGAVIIGVAWPLWWDVPHFRNQVTGRDSSRLLAPWHRDDLVSDPSRAGPVLCPTPPNVP